jgi:5-amino-6-(5-phosphoribosylamino)uracil reductase
MRRLLPAPADDISVDEAYAAPLGSNTERPWVGLCMVSSIDGSIAVGGTSAQLSSPTDAAVLARLRQLADVILVGAGTVRDEGYGPPRTPGQRIGVVTRSGRLDFAGELFTSGAAFVVTSGSASVDIPSGIDVLRTGRDEVDVAELLQRLPEVVDRSRFVQAEGGAALNGELFAADVVDEVNLTTSPAVFGGDGPRLTSGAAPITHRFDLAHLAVDDESFLYARWLRRRG